MSRTRDSGSTKKNRNARRSIRLLEKSFLQLLSEKPYEKITVTDVTAAADLNRGTFYAHFESMDALRDQVFDELTKTLSALIDRAIGASFIEDPQPVLTEIGRYLEANRELLQRLMESKTLEPFLQSLRASLSEHIHAYLTKADPSEAQRSVLVADYLSYGMLGVYRAWLMGEYGDLSVEEVNADLAHLIVSLRS